MFELGSVTYTTVDKILVEYDKTKQVLLQGIKEDLLLPSYIVKMDKEVIELRNAIEKHRLTVGVFTGKDREIIKYQLHKARILPYKLFSYFKDAEDRNILLKDNFKDTFITIINYLLEGIYRTFQYFDYIYPFLETDYKKDMENKTNVHSLTQRHMFLERIKRMTMMYENISDFVPPFHKNNDYFTFINFTNVFEKIETEYFTIE